MPDHRARTLGGLVIFIFLIMFPPQVSAKAAILADFPSFYKNLNLKAGENATVYLYIVNNAEVSDENCWAVIRSEVYQDNKIIEPKHFSVLIDPENSARDDQAPISEKDVIAVFTTPGQPVVEVPPREEWSEYVDTYVKILGENKFYPARMVKVVIIVSKEAPSDKYLLVFPIHPWTGQAGGIQIIGETAPFVTLNIIAKPGVNYVPIIVILLCIVGLCLGFLMFRNLQRR
ncbi:MAG: hypothetical protein QXX33_05305 [Candidatus Hadarchaeales archaeon]